MSGASLDAPLVGHSEQRQALGDAMLGERMHHGWLLHGPKGIGKARFALQASAFLVAEAARRNEALEIDPSHPDARLIAQNAHPDAIWLDRLTGLASGRKVPKTIPVASVRDGLHKLQSTAAYGGWRTLVVDAIDDLNADGANALLKPLEEPPRKTVLFLIAHRLSAVLPTLRSRCRLLAFSPLDPETMHSLEQWRESAQADGHAEQRLALAAALADGRPGVMAELMANPDVMEAYAQFCMAVMESGRAGLSDRLAFSRLTAGLEDSHQAVLLGLVDDWLSRRVRGLAEPDPLPTPSGPLGLAGCKALADLWSQLGADLSVRRAINLDIAERMMALFAGLDRVYSEGRSP